MKKVISTILYTCDNCGYSVDGERPLTHWIHCTLSALETSLTFDFCSVTCKNDFNETHKDSWREV